MSPPALSQRRAVHTAAAYQEEQEEEEEEARRPPTTTAGSTAPNTWQEFVRANRWANTLHVQLTATPLMSLTDALRPLSTLLGNLEHYVRQARGKAREVWQRWNNGEGEGEKAGADLTEDMMAMIALYTMPWEEEDGAAFYEAMNSEMNKDSRSVE